MIEQTDDFADWENDFIEDISSKIEDISSLVIYSRDWTVETIVSQITQNNINLNPKFQRRNVWQDDRRSRLIESLICGLPVPEIVLAEEKSKKKSFIVIDGKQRLLSIIGFLIPEKNQYQYWDNAKLCNLQLRRDLNGKTINDIKNEKEDYRHLLNSDIRCTILSNYKNDDLLYDIFFRLNTGSVPLSSQELRQALNPGEFGDFLIDFTDEIQPIHKILKLKSPDKRLRDAEILLRFLSIKIFGSEYKGNLRSFLDTSMKHFNKKWKLYEPEILKISSEFNESILRLIKVFKVDKVGRRVNNGKWESRFNKVLFEVEAFYFSLISDNDISEKAIKNFIIDFSSLCDKDPEFRASIESSTKDLNRYVTRYKKFQNLINKSFNKNIDIIPIGS